MGAEWVVILVNTFVPKNEEQTLVLCRAILYTFLNEFRKNADTNTAQLHGSLISALIRVSVKQRSNIFNSLVAR